MAQERKHHYVPKFLLRQFSADKKRIDVFLINNKRYFKSVVINFV
nr:hypothetical protein GTC16762_31930 [Pigmentibacter ruber]